MSSSSSRLGSTLLGPEEALPNQIRTLLASQRAFNVKTLQDIVAHLVKCTLGDDLLVNCVLAIVECVASLFSNAVTPSGSAEDVALYQPPSPVTLLITTPEKLLHAIIKVVSLLYQRRVSPRHAVRLCRCMARILPKRPSKEHLSYVVHVLSNVCSKSTVAKEKCAYTQECVLWFLWFYLLQPKFETVPNVGFVDAHLMHWNMLSCTLLCEWSLALPPMDAYMASRLTCQLIRLASICEVDTFRMLSSLRFKSDLQDAITCMGRRALDAGLKAAEEASVVNQYSTILDYLSNVLIVNIEQGKKNLLQLAETTVELVRCLLIIPEQSLDQAFLLLRHVVYNRTILSEEELPRLLRTLCTLREDLPFSDPQHSVWGNEALAKVANNIANALKSCKEVDQAQKLEETFVLIMCTLLPRFPTSKDCLQLLRVALMGIEVAMNIVLQTNNLRPNTYVSPRCVAAILRLYGPTQIDPLVLIACETSLRKQNAFLYEELSPIEPDRFKWLALEMYALLRIGAPKEDTDRVEAQLRACRVSDKKFVDVVTVLSLRARAQHNGEKAMDIIRTEVPGDNPLLESAIKGLWFSLRLRQLSEEITSEIDKSEKLLFQSRKSSHENVDAFERRELMDDLPLALQGLRYANYTDIFQSLMWIFANYQKFKAFDYWTLLATSVLDDLKLASGFLAINGDISNHLRMLSIIEVLMKACSAPKSVVIDNRLRVAEALVNARCLDLADAVLKKIKGQIEAGIGLDCEDVFQLRHRLEMLRLWVTVERRESKPSPDAVKELSKSARVATIDKLRICGLNRYYHGRALSHWGIIESGKRTATDVFNSASRNIKMCAEHLESRNPTMMTWERFDIALPMLLTECDKADAFFDLGSVREAINATKLGCTDGQILFSFYFTLRHIKRMMRISLFFDRPIESKMKIVGDILDVKTGTKRKIEARNSDEEQPFQIKSTSTIPYHTAMYLKMRQIQDAKAEKRVPAKEFVKFHRRQRHPATCKCALCYSLGIHMTLKKLDAITAHITMEEYACKERCVENRLAKPLGMLMQTLGLPPPPEQIQHLFALSQEIELRHTFSIAHGHALLGNYSKALETLASAERIIRQAGSRHDVLEMELLRFEYSFNVNWSTALSGLGLCNNDPVQLVPEMDHLLKTPAVTRKPISKPAPPRRRLPFPTEDDVSSGSSSKGKSEVPAKKMRVVPSSRRAAAVSTAAVSDAAFRKVAFPELPADSETGAASHFRPIVTQSGIKAARKQQGEDGPKFKLLDENCGRVTRARRKANIPRSDELAGQIVEIDDLTCADDLCLEDQFLKICLADRFEKPFNMSIDRVDECFQTLFNAGRPCVPIGKRVLLTNLFTNLAFLSAWRSRKDHFQFYLEKSLGVSVQLAGLNRGAKMASHYEDELLNSTYFDWLRPTVEFEDRWHEKMWEWCDPDWTIVQVSTMFNREVTPDLVVTRYQKDCDPQTVCVNSNYDYQFRRAFIREFEDIIIQNHISLKPVEKSSYWKLRESTDRRLHEFLESLENQWIGCWKGMFLGQLKDDAAYQVVLELADTVKMWVNRRQLQVDSALLIIGLTALPLLNLRQLVTLLCRVIQPNPSSVGDVQKLATDLKHIADDCNLLTRSVKRSPVILVLDRHLINLPFDSCPMYHEYDVTRMPCIGLIAAQAQLQRLRSEARSPAEAFTLSDPGAGFYCINPGADLADSEKRFRRDMPELVERWEGTLGKPMEREDFKKVNCS
ncbi:hypothetical protein BIW11_02470 [Tropilaelaps mercedesae]|uniref:separase n=1 Tax=Tropilaelaps mercedesae TaxID=418985 RepID=A0A1V9Y2J0_9ACAR|nr:hypothetical protein BIW11_02470 [Tropilaelaps mercedesae]